MVKGSLWKSERRMIRGGCIMKRTYQFVETAQAGERGSDTMLEEIICGNIV
jgi:hypothetical protein